MYPAVAVSCTALILGALNLQVTDRPAVRGLVYLGHVDATLLGKVSLTNGTKRKALPLLLERMSMSKIVSSQLQLLGLEKRTRVRSLSEDLQASPTLLDSSGTPVPDSET